MASADAAQITVTFDEFSAMALQAVSLDQGNIPSLEAFRASLDAMDRRDQAQHIHTTTRTRGLRRMSEYVLDGLGLFVFKERKLHTEIGYSSFDEWLHDPETHLDGGPTYAHQTVASVALFHVFFEARIDALLGIGFAKFMKINPQAAKLQEAVEAGEMVYMDARGQALDWLDKARSMSVRDLEAELFEDKSNGAYTTFFDGAVDIKTLKEMTAVELMAFFGIDALQDESVVVIQIRGK